MEINLSGQSVTKRGITFTLLIALIWTSGPIMIGQGENPLLMIQNPSISQNGRGHSFTAISSVNCRPGTGWQWTIDPDRPDIAQQVQDPLRQQGIQASVIASSYGEKDSCGNFEASATDFRVTLRNTLGVPSVQQPTLSDQILRTLSHYGTPTLGNTWIDYGAGKTRLYYGSGLAANTSTFTTLLPSATAALNKKVYLLVYNPILSNGQDFDTYMGWPLYPSLVDGIISSFKTASHGKLQYKVTYTYLVNDQWPVKIDGFRYSEPEYLTAYQNGTPHEPNDVDYDAILGDPRFDICGKLNRGEMDELWIYAGPYDGFYESRLVGPGGYAYNSPPMTNSFGCNKLLPIMGLNFERGVAEALHSFGHRTEATMVEVYGSWEQNRTAHNWERYTLVKALSPSYSYSGCGNIHYPPNGVTDYDYGNPGTTLTNCNDFLNYPNLSNPQTVAKPVTCMTWSCDHEAYLMYWYSHLPYQTGCTNDAIANNWWLYFSDVNLSLSPSSVCPSVDTTGVFRPTNGLLYLKNTNDTGFADAALNYGLPGDYPVVGDWDGNGTVTIGIYRDGYFYLKNANTLGFADVVFPSGKVGDQPVAGDWNGDGVDTVGVYRPSTGQFLLRNSNSEGAEDASFYLGNVGDVGIAGDWDGDGLDTTGVFRPSNGLLYLKNKNETGFADVALNYGLPGDMPVTGDWDNDGVDTIGVYRQGQFMLRNENTIGFAELIFGLGNPGDMPIAGNWDGLP